MKHYHGLLFVGLGILVAMAIQPIAAKLANPLLSSVKLSLS